jgi:hypothetical protein
LLRRFLIIVALDVMERSADGISLHKSSYLFSFFLFLGLKIPHTALSLASQVKKRIRRQPIAGGRSLLRGFYVRLLLAKKKKFGSPRSSCCACACVCFVLMSLLR